MFHDIRWFDRLNSTQTYLKEHPGIPPYTVIVAKEQTAGYGRQGAPWQSQPRENLLFSYRVPTTHERAPYEWQRVLRALYETLLSYGIQCTIKPPNDLYVGHQKLAGILVETKESEGLHAYVGVGLNINQTSFGNLQATSLKQLTMKTYSLQDVLHQLLETLTKLTILSPDALLIWYTNHIDFDRFNITYQNQVVDTVTRLEDGYVLFKNRRIHPSLFAYELKNKKT